MRPPVFCRREPQVLQRSSLRLLRRLRLPGPHRLPRQLRLPDLLRLPRLQLQLFPRCPISLSPEKTTVSLLPKRTRFLRTPPISRASPQRPLLSPEYLQTRTLPGTRPAPPTVRSGLLRNRRNRSSRSSLILQRDPMRHTTLRKSRYRCRPRRYRTYRSGCPRVPIFPKI